MDAVLRSFAYSLDYVRELVADVTDEDMVIQPHSMSSHPAWLIGHLTYSCQAIGGEILLPPWLGQDFAQRFGTGSTPVNDPAAYEPKSISLAALEDAQLRITTAVQQLNGNQLDQPLPDEQCRNVLPTVRDALTQVLVAHTAYHVGQLPIWRRLMGFDAVARPYL